MVKMNLCPIHSSLIHSSSNVSECFQDNFFFVDHSSM